MNDPKQLPEAQRQYYRDTWGFDPVSDRKPLRFGKNFLLSIVGKIEEESPEEEEETPENKEGKEGEDYYYESVFNLDSDPGLQFIGISIAARVEVYSDGTLHNYLVFRQGRRLTRVNCVHTVVYALNPTVISSQTPLVPEGNLRSTASHPAIIPPWEHFAALKSYVAGIADIGLKNILIATYIPDDSPLFLPFGFNALMQEQVLRAIRTLSPQAALTLAQGVIGELLETKSDKWFREHFEELDKIWDLHAVGRSSLDLFLRLDDILGLEEFRISARVSPDTHPEVKKYIDQKTGEREPVPAPSQPRVLEKDREILQHYTEENFNQYSEEEPVSAELRAKYIGLVNFILSGHAQIFTLKSRYWRIPIVFVTLLLFPVLSIPPNIEDFYSLVLLTLAGIATAILWLIHSFLVRLELNLEGFKYRTLWGIQSVEWRDLARVDLRIISSSDGQRPPLLRVELIQGMTFTIFNCTGLRSEDWPRDLPLLELFKVYYMIYQDRTKQDQPKTEGPPEYNH